MIRPLRANFFLCAFAVHPSCSYRLTLCLPNEPDDTGSGYAIFLDDIGQRHSGNTVADKCIVVNVDWRTVFDSLRQTSICLF
jgi:hypothetical protein